MVKVDLGSGLQAYETPEYIHVDVIKNPDINYVWNLENGLPIEYHSSGSSGNDDLYGRIIESKVFEDDSVDEFRAHHVLEHIRNLIRLMDEMWDALKPDGVLRVYVPNAHHVRAAWSDPTHVRAFTPETFDYFTHGTLAAYPYTKKEWEIVERKVNGTPPDDLWEIEVIMRPVKPK